MIFISDFYQCLICKGQTQPDVKFDICEECWPMVHFFESQAYYIKSIFQYTGALRTLILEAKANRNPRALNAINMLMAEYSRDWFLQLHRFRLDSIHIMPCPSSLWSRLNGKQDIGQALAFNLLKKNLVHKVIQPPWGLYFKVEKESLKAKRIDQKPLLKETLKERNALLKRNGKALVVLDDVLTTGTTMLRMLKSIASLEQDYGQVFLLSLARA